MDPDPAGLDRVRDALRGGLAFDGSGFPLDSLFCEWGYLVDFDSRTFEVYRGLQTTPPTAGRFVDRPTVRDGRFPMTLVASWPLVALPDEGSFMALPGAY